MGELLLDIKITIHNDNGFYVIESIDQKKQIQQLVGNQLVVRNLGYTPNPIEFYRITDIFISSEKGEPFAMLISLDLYSEESFIKISPQYYSILDTHNFYEELTEILTREE